MTVSKWLLFVAVALFFVLHSWSLLPKHYQGWFWWPWLWLGWIWWLQLWHCWIWWTQLWFLLQTQQCLFFVVTASVFVAAALLFAAAVLVFVAMVSARLFFNAVAVARQFLLLQHWLGLGVNHEYKAGYSALLA